MMRKQPHFHRFQAEHPDLEKRLYEAISTIDIQSPQMSEDLKPFDQDLYDFYLTMRSYGTSDENLIGRA